MLDLAIVGAGPCGLACAAAAQRAGLSYVVLERGAVVHTLARFPVRMRFFSTSDRLAIAGVPFITLDPHPTREEALAYYRGVVRALGLRVETYSEVTAAAREGDGFTLAVRSTRGDGRQRRLAARALVVATGAFDHPNRLGVPGEDLPHVSHYFREAHPYFGRRVVVVGGRNSAVEAATELARAGARVTLVHRGPDLSDRVKPWILPAFRSLQRQGAIEAVWEATVERIEPDAVVVRQGEARWPVPADFVFVLTGFRPEHGLLRALGARVDEERGEPVHDPATLETTVPGVYVCGVVVAGYDANRVFIENGRHHGDRIVRHLLRRRGWREEEVVARLGPPPAEEEVQG